ncbi:origin of replication complex subunit 5-like [Punica granatum]|uniref:Uncharacterized protein n=2 Tax=Punica granatum TaxID=22663 RepID=A0A218Y153_PUNGR|nr:origin of replication complex subunit 5-like [Punica granatum]OWM90808.1 hypothetical protein CDL15_Pgr011568 [Punica granatum]PKI39009.1 hypothetical protein CRG98_040607 [Punica granatum]
MAKEESPRVSRRSTRSATSTPTSNKITEGGTEEAVDLCSPSVSDLVYGDPISLDVLLSTFPGRKNQILDLIQLLGPLNSPTLPFFVYGGPSTGKTSVILQLFRHLNRPFVYSSFRTCYSLRILFESILNQLILHHRNAANGYSSAKRCDKPSDFVILLREALTGVIKSLKESVGKSKFSKSERPINGYMTYLIFDNLEVVREWGKASSLLPFLFNLYDILKIPEVGVIFISSTSPDMFYSNMSCVEPIPIYFPSYAENDLRQILLRNQANQKLYSSFLDVVLRPFCRITRRLDELCPIFATLYMQYCKPLSDPGAVPNEDMKRRLYSNLQPEISSALNEIFRVQSRSSPEAETSRKPEQIGGKRKLASSEKLNELDFHMCTSAKYLLISSFLASRNPATLDASLFDSTGGSDSRKRRRKSSDKVKAQQETAEEELLTKGPGSFPLERLLAIYQCLTSVAEGSPDEEAGPDDWIGIGGENNMLSSDVLLQISSLCNANILVKGGSCPLEGSTRYRCMVSEDLALKVARTLRFPLAKYIYRR